MEEQGRCLREGVQEIYSFNEGTTVNTKHGPIKTDHILFIASGAFQLAKPSDFYLNFREDFQYVLN